MGAQLSFAFHFAEHPAVLRVAVFARVVWPRGFRCVVFIFHALARQLSHHKVRVFTISGALIVLSFVQIYAIAPRLRKNVEACPADDPSCDRATKISRALLWVSATIYAIGFFAAFMLGPILSRMDER